MPCNFKVVNLLKHQVVWLALYILNEISYVNCDTKINTIEHIDVCVICFEVYIGQIAF